MDSVATVAISHILRIVHGLNALFMVGLVRTQLVDIIVWYTHVLLAGLTGTVLNHFVKIQAFPNVVDMECALSTMAYQAASVVLDMNLAPMEIVLMLLVSFMVVTVGVHVEQTWQFQHVNVNLIFMAQIAVFRLVWEALNVQEMITENASTGHVCAHLIGKAQIVRL
jgi:hypothetical protein